MENKGQEYPLEFFYIVMKIITDDKIERKENRMILTNRKDIPLRTLTFSVNDKFDEA